jgi:predicted aconitase with swiveling domain
MSAVIRAIRVLRAWGPAVEGEALVMREGFSPRYDLDRWTGVISRIGHSVEGQSIKDKILVIPTVKGGVAAGWAFFDLVHKAIAPRGLVFGRLNPVFVQGAVLAKMPITEGWEPDALEVLHTGDLIRLDPASKSIEVLSRP